MNKPLEYGATIGILGGGQLGRMLSVAASRLGFKSHIFDPAPSPPASDVAHLCITASFEDNDALIAFAKAVDVITYEFENIPAFALNIIKNYAPVRPDQEALRVSQDRLIEKNFLSSLRLKTAPYADTPDFATLLAQLNIIGEPAILKTRRFGYDGKGQYQIRERSDAEKAFNDLKHAPTILEGFVDFSHEISVIAARGTDGSVACFDPGENVHKDGILRSTTLPARLSADQRTDAILTAACILNSLDFVGVMGVEMFVTPQGLIVNEIAPRVHNSGHWTQNGCIIDQFEQHIRAIVGWPLGDGQRHSDIIMENIIGDDILRLPEIACEPNSAVHLYGKVEALPGRKMGHVNRKIS